MKKNEEGAGSLRSPGASRQEEAYQRGYIQGVSDAMNSIVKGLAALRNPPPILIDARNIDPEFLASLVARSPEARSAPSPQGEGPSPTHPHPGEGRP